ncbi:MAG: DUF296 domain-containing protein [Pyramidobacter sp.]|nr:DUF296 domain-containing protein [Pyramidobacter sp.]
MNAHDMLSSASFTALRLKPGDELLTGLRAALAPFHERAAFVAASVGSLSLAAVRFAGKSQTALLHGTFEVLSLSGTIDAGGEHLHICISDENGMVMGGHLMEGSVVRTTMELVVGFLPGFVFEREHCPLSTYDELKISLADKGEKNDEE